MCWYDVDCGWVLGMGTARRRRWTNDHASPRVASSKRDSMELAREVRSVEDWVGSLEGIGM
jgi:hypothetical protein